MKIYRKIWESHFGLIPVDEDGRTYEIHHINGNHNDNRIENLLCLSISDHFKLHYDQGDYLAAASIAIRMNQSREVISDISKLGGLEAKEKKLGWFSLTKEKMLENSIAGGKANKGIFWFNNGTISIRSRECPGDGWVRGRVPCGTGMKHGTKLGVFWNNGSSNVRSNECPGDGWVRGKYLSDEQRKRRSEIASSYIRSDLSRNKQSEKLKGKLKPKLICPHCKKLGGRPAMIRWHFDNCKVKGI